MCNVTSRIFSSRCITILFFLVLFFSCKKRQIPIIPDAEYAEYISSYTNGIISTQAPIIIEFAKDVVSENEVGTSAQSGLVEFDPKVSSSLVWKSRHTLQITPEKPLKPDSKYIATFHLSKVMSVKKGLEDFYIRFSTLPQNFDINFDGPRFYNASDASKYLISGTVTTTDKADSNKVQKLLNASQNGSSKTIKWFTSPDNQHFNFVIEDIKRTKNDETVAVKWNGEELNVKNNDGERLFEIPSINSFKIIDITTFNETDQYISIIFSDPIKRNQDFRGLVQLSNYKGELTFNVNINELKIYLNPRTTGNMNLKIYRGLLNTLNGVTLRDFEEEVTFEELMPSVRFPNTGNILPNSEGLVLPFEAVNLKKVDIIISKVHENNLRQFFQVNNFDGISELHRVSSRLTIKQVNLLNYATQKELKAWNRYTIDLNELIKKDKGALYRVEVRFKPSYSTYNCANENNVTIEDKPYSDEMNTENISYEYEDDYYGYYYDSYSDYEEYNWSQRDDACYPAYFNSDRFISKNILATNLGLMTKIGMDNNVHFIVNDLISSNPVSGANIELYDFQNQLIQKITTNSDGFAECAIQKKAFLAIAKYKDDKTYLRLDDANTLSTSAFDVSGTSTFKGLKGYLYGERGVWRPGEDLFLTFILEDKYKKYNTEQPITFTLYDPNGKQYSQYSTAQQVNGMYHFKTKTSVESPTGNWLCVVQAGGNKFEKRLKIENVKPNRLKIDVTFDKTIFTKNDKNISGKVYSTWLTGAQASAFTTNMNVKYVAQNISFKGYNDFIFSNAGSEIDNNEKEFFTKKLDENGNLIFSEPINFGKQSPSAISAYFTTKVFEPSGNFSIRYDHTTIYPYESYVGLKLPKGKGYSNMLESGVAHKIDIANVDAYGKKIAQSNAVGIYVYKMEYGWWWDSEYSLGSNFRSTFYNEPIMQDTLYTNNGTSSFIFKLDKPNWGMYAIKVVDLKSGHTSAQRIYADWYGNSNDKTKESGASLLSFNTDKPNYQVGEKIKMQLPLDKSGNVLVSIENGSKILQKQWFTANGANTSIDITATEDMIPNAYIHVTYIQPHANTTNDKPIRLYGIVPIKVESKNTVLQPILNMPSELKPEQEFTLSIREQNGKPMAYTIAIVDEGLLGLTNYKTPDPYNHFFAKEALGVKTWDLYNSVIGAFGSRIERLLSIGGDENAKSKDAQNANRFKPVVKYIGPFYVSANETKSHTIKLPQYIGAVRTMVVAADNGKYGNAEKTVQVKKPLMILATMPRVLGIGETLDLPIDVFAMDKKVKDVSITIENNNLISVEGNNMQQLHFDKTGNKLLNFKIKVAPNTGIAKVRVKASSAGETAYDEIEIDTRNPNAPEYKVVEANINNKGSYSFPNFNIFGTKGTNKATLEVSTLINANLEKRLQYLIQYPHGCLEQTTSSVFPQLALLDIMDVKETEKNKIETNIKMGINRLYNFQTNDGGFGYWQGDNYNNPWGTSYAGNFLLLAKQKGYNVNASVMSKWLKYQQGVVRNYTPTVEINGNIYSNNSLIHAYALYTLALNNTPEIGAMNRLREVKNISLPAQWMLAGAYALAGKPEVAKQITQNLTYQTATYRELDYTFGSDFRDKSISLITLSLINNQTKAPIVAREVSKLLALDDWYSTQETAFALIALAKYAGKNTSKSGLDATITCNGKKYEVKTNKSIYTLELPLNENGQNDLQVKNNKDGECFARITQSGKPALGGESASSSNLSISSSFTDLNGKLIDISKLKQGTDFIATVTITNPGLREDYRQLALTQIFPSGWEIMNERMSQNESVSNADFRDFKDDRVLTYFSLYKNRSITFKVRLNATYKGNFYLSGALAEAMYDKTISAREKGRWVSVE